MFVELALRELDLYRRVSQGCKHLPYVLYVLLDRLGVYEDVVQVDYYKDVEILS